MKVSGWSVVIRFSSRFKACNAASLENANGLMDLILLCCKRKSVKELSPAKVSDESIVDSRLCERAKYVMLLKPENANGSMELILLRTIQMV